jgi:hypothetical protein
MQKINESIQLVLARKMSLPLLASSLLMHQGILKSFGASTILKLLCHHFSTNEPTVVSEWQMI